MKESEILKLLTEVGAIITDNHFVLTSGKHASAYVNKDALYPHTKETSQLCRAIAERYAKDSVEVVLGPALGGIILSQWIAYHLSDLYGHEVRSVYAEKTNEGGFVIKRGYDKIIAGAQTLVVEDIINTGGSVQKAVLVARENGANVIGVGALCNRGAMTAESLAVPRLETLVTLKLESWEESACPLCGTNIPINTKIGHGAAYLAHKKAA